MKTNQNVECLVCSFNSSYQNFECVSHQANLDLLKCPECTFQFWYPPTQASREFFEINYRSFADISSKPNFGLRHKMTLKYIPINTGTVLDIGCGDSLFLPELQNRGFDVWGVDFNRLVIEKNKKLFGLTNLFAMSIYDFVSLEGLPKFDLITFFEVLEHIELPKKFITTVKNMLKENGFIALSAPDYKMFGPWEKKVNVGPYHTAYWTTDTLKIFLEKNGFEIITFKKIARPDSISWLVNALIILKLVKNPSGGVFKYAVDHYKSSLYFRVLKFLWQLITFPIREFLYILGIRPTIFIIAQLKGR